MRERRFRRPVGRSRVERLAFFSFRFRPRRRLWFFRLSPPTVRPPPRSFEGACCPLSCGDALLLALSSRPMKRERRCDHRRPLGAPPLIQAATDRCVIEEPQPREASKPRKRKEKLRTFCANRSAADVLSPVVITAVTTGRFLATSEYQWPVATKGLASERASEAIFFVSFRRFGFFSEGRGFSSLSPLCSLYAPSRPRGVKVEEVDPAGEVFERTRTRRRRG